MKNVSIIIPSFGDPSIWDRLAIRAYTSARKQSVEINLIWFILADNLLDARNMPGLAVETDWLIFLDADDELDERYVEHMLAGEGDIRVPSIQKIVDGKLGPVERFEPANSLLDRNHIPIGAMIRTEQFKQVGGFDDWPIWEDWGFFLKLVAAGAKWKFCPEAIYKIHVRPGGRNEWKPEQAQWFEKIRNDALNRSGGHPEIFLRSYHESAR